MRPTLRSGELWDENLANSSGYPVLDGQDLFGHGPKAVDDWLSDEPDQIKARFYGWQQRVRISQSSGLIVTYNGATVIKINGQPVALQAGSLTLPANSSVYIFISEGAQVSFAASLPAAGVLLAFAVTNGTAVVNLTDLRYQVAERVTALGVSDSSGFRIGDMKESSRQFPDPGWALCDNELYQRATYPLAYDAIGRVWSRPGDPVDTFRVPPPGRVFIGAGDGTGLSPRTLGDMGGAESVLVNLPRHSHQLTDTGHSHPVDDRGHAHPVTDPGHNHPLLAQDFGGDGRTDSLIKQNAALSGEDRGNFAYILANSAGTPLMQRSGANISVNGAGANVRVSSAATGAVVQPEGANQATNIVQPFYVGNKFIRLY